MTKTKSLYHGHRFPASLISHAVRWTFRFQLGPRDVEELLFECGVTVSYETIRRWCEKFGTGFIHRVKAARGKPGRTWNLNVLFITLRGEPYRLWRAVDEHGVELDILLQQRRAKTAAKRFFKRVLRSNSMPCKIVTDQLRSDPASLYRKHLAAQFVAWREFANFIQINSVECFLSTSALCIFIDEVPQADSAHQAHACAAHRVRRKVCPGHAENESSGGPIRRRGHSPTAESARSARRRLKKRAALIHRIRSDSSLTA